MRYGLLLAMAILLGLSMPAMGLTVTGMPDSIIIGNATFVPGQNQASVPVYFVTHGGVTHYNLPLIIESAGDILFTGQEISPALEGWDDHWQGLKSDHRQALELGFADLGGEDNPSLNTNGARVEVFRLIFSISDNPETRNAAIRSRVDDHSGVPIFGYSDGVTGVVPVIVDGSLTFAAEGIPQDMPLPGEISLNQNYPNPFNPSTDIMYTLPETREVSLMIYNVLGQTVRTLVSGSQEAGYHRVTWNGCDNSGRQVPSGTYFYTLKAGDFSQSMKMVMLK
jgi:hypothetical protein